MFPIKIISKINKVKVQVGEYDGPMRIAYFMIKPEHIFKEANQFGLDSKLFNRQELKWICDILVFRFANSRKEYWIPKSKFLEHAWEYPKKNSLEYKANSSNFDKKLFINHETADKLKLTPDEVDLEKTKRMLMSGQIA